MNQEPKELILDSLKNCIESKQDLFSFCEEFCFHYLYLDNGAFKSACTSLFEHATDFLMLNSSLITPETILSASDLLEQIQLTYKELLVQNNTQ